MEYFLIYTVISYVIVYFLAKADYVFWLMKGTRLSFLAKEVINAAFFLLAPLSLPASLLFVFVKAIMRGTRIFVRSV